MLRGGHSPQTRGLAVLGEEEEAWRRAHGKMEKRSSEGGGRGGKRRAEEGPKGRTGDSGVGRWPGEVGVVEILHQSLIPGLNPPGTHRQGHPWGSRDGHPWHSGDRTHRPPQSLLSHSPIHRGRADSSVFPGYPEPPRGASRGLCPLGGPGAGLLCCAVPPPPRWLRPRRRDRFPSNLINSPQGDPLPPAARPGDTRRGRGAGGGHPELAGGHGASRAPAPTGMGDAPLGTFQPAPPTPSLAPHTSPRPPASHSQGGPSPCSTLGLCPSSPRSGGSPEPFPRRIHP